MSTNSLVQLALTALGCSQKELASRLGVSPAQVSKWKNGEYMSTDMTTKLCKITGIGERDPDFVFWAGSLKDAEKWEKLLHFLADFAVEGAGTGYHTYRLEEEEEESSLHWQTFLVLREMGVDLPKPFPKELDFDYDDEVNLSADELIEKVLSNPHASLIEQIYRSYTDVYGFYAAYVSDLIDKLDLLDTPACNIEPCLLSLAASKLVDAPSLATNFREFQWKIKKDYTKWLTLVKEEAYREGVPLRAELLDMVHQGHDSLGHEAEAESLGVHASRLHPDIYMNELLVGMRAIHQVLPAIMKKLGIHDEFELDESELRLS